MLWWSLLTKEMIYVAMSVAVAVILWFEGLMLRNTGGKLPTSLWFNLGSIFDTLWFFVSLAVLYFLDFPNYALAVPVAYCVYTLFGWVYGTRLLRKKGIPDNVDELVIPAKYTSYSQSFAIVFFVLCVMVLLSLSGVIHPPKLS